MLQIALVDDDAAILDALTLVLEGEGCQVQSFSSGERFLEWIGSNVIDCLILDPHLPGLNGAEVARSLANRFPILGLTARPNSPVTADMQRAGAHIVLTKPVTLERLVASIHKAVAYA